MNKKKFVPVVMALVVTAGGIALITTNKDPERGSPPPGSELKDTKSRELPILQSRAQNNRLVSLKQSSIRSQVIVEQLRRLDATTLNETEIDYLYGLLRHEPLSHRKEDWWVILNEVMGQIVSQQIQADRIAVEFCGLIKDRNLNYVVRDYAVQHISDYASQDDITEEAHNEILQVLREVIEDPFNQQTSIPGTTLIALTQICNNGSHGKTVKSTFDQLEDYLTPLISGQTYSTLATRTSAINAIGIMRSEQYLPLLTQLVSDNETNDSVKLSSVAALGDLCSEDNNNLDIEEVRLLLCDLAEGHTKFSYAASSALKKIK